MCYTDEDQICPREMIEAHSKSDHVPWQTEKSDLAEEHH